MFQEAFVRRGVVNSTHPADHVIDECSIVSSIPYLI